MRTVTIIAVVLAVLTGWSVFAAVSEGKPASRHDDLMVIYAGS